MSEHPFARALNLASGSLQRLDFHPIMNHFCFSDGLVYAYNGVTATLVNLNHDLSCAVRGDVMVKLLENASKKLKVKQVEDQCHIRDGRRFMRLPTMSSEAFLFEPPNEEIECSFVAGEDFFTAMDMAIHNLMSESYTEELSGVTMEIADRTALIYSYDYASLLRSSIKVKQKSKVDHEPIIMPRAVADRARRIYQMLGDSSAVATVDISASMITITYRGAGVALVGNLSTEKEAIDFEENLRQHPITSDVFEVPAGLKQALENSVVLMGEDLSATVSLSTSEGMMELACAGHYGKANFKFQTPDITELTINFNPRVMLRHVEQAKEMGFCTKKRSIAVQFMNDSMRFVVGNKQAKAASKPSHLDTGPIPTDDAA